MEQLPTRWEVELEFVQSLANIQYVNYLAQNDYFSDPAFIAYLEYLNYWKESQYAKYLVYPNCLHILTLLQREEFRKSIVNPDFMNTLMNDMVKKWQNTDNGEEIKEENLPAAEAEAGKSSENGANSGEGEPGSVPNPPAGDTDMMV